MDIVLRELAAADGLEVSAAMMSNEEYYLASTGYFPGAGDLQSMFYTLPEGASQTIKRVISILVDACPVGVIDALVGWPAADTVTIGQFVIARDRQRQGIGWHAAAMGLAQAGRAGFKTVRAGCPAGWLPGERFLTSQHFTPEHTGPGGPMNRVINANERDVLLTTWTIAVIRDVARLAGCTNEGLRR